MERNLRKERIGVVVSNKMDKSIVVAVRVKEKHPVYGKFVNKTTKFVAHDEKNTCDEGDTVRIMRRRRYSPHHGDPSPEQDQTLEISRNRRKSEVK